MEPHSLAPHNQLMRQLHEEPAGGVTMSTKASGPKPRSWSSMDRRPVLSPSPAIIESGLTSKDDSHVAPPTTPRRPPLITRGLSLQMPPRDVSSTSTANLSTRIPLAAPLSPKLDSSISYGSNTPVLPRRSRGLDFARACTNLHHSTLAEQSSPDSSPVIGGRAVNAPRKHNSSGSSVVPDSPGFASLLWSSMPGVERTAPSSSVGSTNMIDSDSDSDMSYEHAVELNDEDETIHMTPQAFRSNFGNGNPFATGIISSPGTDFAALTSNLKSFQGSRSKSRRNSRKSSVHKSGRVPMGSPMPTSPILRSIETNGYNGILSRQAVRSRRESLSLGTSDMKISDGPDSDEFSLARKSLNDALGIVPTGDSSIDERRNVIRRAVTRRSNMLPKPKFFNRVKAALQEEIAPVDSEQRREAEVIRQVRESEVKQHGPSQPNTTASSPYLGASSQGPADVLDDLSDLMSAEHSQEPMQAPTFSQHTLKSTAEYWNNMESRMTPPSNRLLPRESVSSMSEDMNMDTSASANLSTQNNSASQQPSTTRSSTPQTTTTAPEMSKRLGKRRRDDDLDPSYFKRRAVSPGVSIQGSPILPSSPAQRDASWWQTRGNRENSCSHAAPERVNSGGSNASSTIGKRVGMQGMNDTNDGIMNMSIE